MTKFPYDHTAASINNLVSTEQQTIDRKKDISVFPRGGSFYLEGFKVEGHINGQWRELKEGDDYFFSPIFLAVSVQSGHLAASYFVVTAKATSVKLRYQAVGEYIDEYLLNEILVRGEFNRTDPIEWASFRGRSSFIPRESVNPELLGRSTLDYLAAGINDIAAVLEDDSDVTELYEARLQRAHVRISQAFSEIDKIKDVKGSRVYIDDTEQSYPVILLKGVEAGELEVLGKGSEGIYRATVTFNIVDGNVDLKGSTDDLKFSVRRLGANLYIYVKASFVGRITSKTTVLLEAEDES
jgi:hypothetical protein